MKSDEKYIESRFGKSAPFTVPDGYFDSLAQSIINNAGPMPEPQPSVELKAPGAEIRRTASWWMRYRLYVAAAACLVFVAMGASVFFASSHHADGARNVAKSAHSEQQVGNQQYSGTYDTEIDYTMLDNEDIYSLVASN